MPIALVFFVQYAYPILFLWVLVEQLGIPIPSIPVLLTAGTLTATHRVSGTYALLAALSACLIADSIWFALGRRYGNSVLRLLCKLSFNSSTCVSKTEGYFTRRGPVTLLFAKFVPGLSTVAAPIAGQTGMPFERFLIYDLAGSIIWAEAYLLAGRFFGDIAKRSAAFFQWLGHFAFLIFALMVLGFIAQRIIKQRRFLLQVRSMRLEPAELMAMLDTAQSQGNPRPLSSTSATPSTICPTPASSPEPCASAPTNSPCTRMSSHSTATSSSTAPAPARRPAPRSPCSCTNSASTASVPCAEDSTAGRKPAIPSTTTSTTRPPLPPSSRSQTSPTPSKPPQTPPGAPKPRTTTSPGCPRACPGACRMGLASETWVLKSQPASKPRTTTSPGAPEPALSLSNGWGLGPPPHRVPQSLP